MTDTRRTTGRGVFGVAAMLTVAALVAACGASNNSNTTSNTPAASTPASSPSSASAVTVKTAKGSLGTYLTGPSGRALYIWMADHNGKSSCSGACASVWPPLITSGSPVGASGVVAGDLGTTTRGNGSEQVTYKGRPLYYFASDTGPGMTKGQGSNSFGAKWWLVSPAGGPVGSTANSGSSSSSSTSSGGGWG